MPSDARPPHGPREGQPEWQGSQVAEPHATIALIFGIASLVGGFAFALGFLGGPYAVILGRTSLNAISESGGLLGGRRRAQAGLFMGVLSTVLLVVFILLILGVFGPGVVKVNGRFY